MGCSIATGTLVSFSERLGEQLTGLESAIKTLVAKAALKHFDETGYRMGGQTCWLHTASTDKLTYYHVSKQRKSMLSNCEGIVVHAKTEKTLWF